MSFTRNLSLGLRGLGNYLTYRPLSVSFEVTHCCNAHCRHCHLRGNVEEERASPEKLGQICRQLRPLVAQASGGEPLLRDDLEQIIRAWRVPERAPAIALTTNASLLTFERYTSLRQAGVDEFSISLDYPDERHDAFRGLHRLFGKISDLIGRLRGEGDPGVILCCVIQSDNYRLLPQMAELALKWGVKLNLSCYTTLRTDAADLMLSGDQVDELEQIAAQLMAFRERHCNIMTAPDAFEKMIAYFRTGRAPGCQTGYRFFNVNPDGTISPCGLHIHRFASREELVRGFSAHNTCEACYTSIRANSERRPLNLLRDNPLMLKLKARRHGARPRTTA